VTIAPGPRDSVEDAFARRAARARVLAGSTRSGEQPLRFAAGLFPVQGTLAAAVEAAHTRRPLEGRLSHDLEGFAAALEGVLAFAAESAPEALAARARARIREDGAVGRERLLTFWSGDQPSSEDYLSRALLRPYVEVLARRAIAPDRAHAPGRCPFCGGLPWIAARRPMPESDGARRALGCALCGGEWTINRLRCPSCAEEDPERLPSFQGESHPGVRIEACEVCHRYVKSIDLTLDGRAIPEVDDLLSLDMDLWAVEHGFERIEPGLAGL
jgi:formate dehydrogenase maturation protein FdhE